MTNIVINNIATKRQIIKFYCKQNKEDRGIDYPIKFTTQHQMAQLYISDILFIQYFTANYSESDGQTLFYVRR